MDSWRKGNNASSLERSVVNEEKMRSGLWLGLALCVSLRTLTLVVGLVVGWKELKDIRPVKTRSSNPQSFHSGTGEERGPDEDRLTQICLEKWPL